MSGSNWVGTGDLSDPVAERMLLGIALTCVPLPGVFLALPPEAFDNWQYRIVADTLRDLHQRGVPTVPEVVLREVLARSGGEESARQLGKLVTDLATLGAPVPGGRYYAERLMLLVHARRLAEEGMRLGQRAQVAARNDDPDVLIRGMTGVSEALEQVRSKLGELEPPEPPLSLGAFLDETEQDHYDWLVPDLFELGDRCVITAAEGLGKSELLAQFALCVAAGIHPFARDPLGPDGFRVLVLDAENPRNKLRRRLRRVRLLVDQIRRQQHREPVDWHQQVRLILRPEGTDLASVAEMSRVERDVALTNPDLMLIGPFYKLSELDTGEEQGARALVALLDRLRVRHNFTLIAETHAGHGTGKDRKIRPIGSSLFLRWPEFGLGLVPAESARHMLSPTVLDVQHWRAPREQRHWPTSLEYGRHLPWEPANLDYWDRPVTI